MSASPGRLDKLTIFLDYACISDLDRFHRRMSLDFKKGVPQRAVYQYDMCTRWMDKTSLN